MPYEMHTSLEEKERGEGVDPGFRSLGYVDVEG